MINTLKKFDRTLLEMHTGMILFGLVCHLVIMIFAGWNTRLLLSLWLGVVMAVAGSVHMGRTLDKALLKGADTSKIIVSGYVVRYTAIAVAFIAMSLTEVLNPLLAFLGYMSMKVAAYLQPFTHKFYNALFHETDPIAQALPEGEEDAEEDVSGEETLSE